MASRFSEYLRSDSTELELGDALRQPTTKLLGVSAAASTALEAIGISTVFDLGTASLFATARAAAAAGGPGELAGRHGMAPGDWLKPGHGGDLAGPRNVRSAAQSRRPSKPRATSDLPANKRHSPLRAHGFFPFVSSSRSAFASFISAVEKPSVNLL